ncbi:MAG: flagellar assembly protein T N-terminal domain-containing protein [Oceanobacter sp.]
MNDSKGHWRGWIVYPLMLLNLGFAADLMAQTVEVTGRAAIGDSVYRAREEALKDAMAQASLRTGAQLRSSHHMSLGEVTQDDVSIQSHSRVSDVDVLWENESKGLYEVAIRAEVKPLAMCPGNQPVYRKSIAVAGFGLMDRQQTSLGQLGDIEQALPRELVQRLGQQGGVRALDASGITLYQDQRRAPSLETQQQRLTTSVSLATQLGAQYVISGVVRDLSLTGQSLEETSPSRPNWRSMLGLPQAGKARAFAVDVFVHDGLSGALLYQNQYRTRGVWSLHPSRAVGFASAEFWSTNYGREVHQLMDGVVDDLAEVLRCQPFMARIVQTRGNRLHIDASAAAGIRPGDRFQVYRTGTFYNLDLEPSTELTDMATEVVIKQVQPQFVIAEMKHSAEHLAIQRDDLVIAW